MTQPKKPQPKAPLTYNNIDFAAGYNHGLFEMEAYYQLIVEELVGALSNITELIENCISDGEASELIKKSYFYLGAKQALAKYKAIK